MRSRMEAFSCARPCPNRDRLVSSRNRPIVGRPIVGRPTEHRMEHVVAWTDLDFLTTGFLIFVAVGFAAQLVDGALGMAYGTLSSTMLITLGASPAQASAMIHAAEVFTTGASGASHFAHRNIDWTLFWRLAPAGIAGGLVGAYVLTHAPGQIVKPFVMAYLAILGVLILLRAFRPLPPPPDVIKGAVPLAAVGGFLDASGGGGWGPVVTSTLVSRGHAPRYVIGTVNTTEFFLTTAISAAFLYAIATGRLEVLGGLQGHLTAVGGLVLGGLAAAPLAGFVTRIIPARILMGLVGGVVILLALWQGWALWIGLIEPYLSLLGAQ